jgi:hypothetical protein
MVEYGDIEVTRFSSKWGREFLIDEDDFKIRTNDDNEKTILLIP